MGMLNARLGLFAGVVSFGLQTILGSKLQSIFDCSSPRVTYHCWCYTAFWVRIHALAAMSGHGGWQRCRHEPYQAFVVPFAENHVLIFNTAYCSCIPCKAPARVLA